MTHHVLASGSTGNDRIVRDFEKALRFIKGESMDIEARLIQRVVREAGKLEEDLKALAPGPRKRVFERYAEEAAKLEARLKEAK